jgi:hypothetical protein
MSGLDIKGLAPSVSACLVLALSLGYVDANPNFDAGTLAVGVVIPLGFGVAVFLAARQRLALFAFLAYFWSLVDDKPVQFDSVLTWPEVTRFHPAGPHIFMEVVLHVLTLAFLVLAAREALKGSHLSLSSTVGFWLLVLIAFGLSYVQNIPLDSIQTLATYQWYPLDLGEHVASLVFLYLAVSEAIRSRKPPGWRGAYPSSLASDRRGLHPSLLGRETYVIVKRANFEAPDV